MLPTAPVISTSMSSPQTSPGPPAAQGAHLFAGDESRATRAGTPPAAARAEALAATTLEKNMAFCYHVAGGLRSVEVEAYVDPAWSEAGVRLHVSTDAATWHAAQSTGVGYRGGVWERREYLLFVDDEDDITREGVDRCAVPSPPNCHPPPPTAPMCPAPRPPSMTYLPLQP